MSQAQATEQVVPLERWRDVQTWPGLGGLRHVSDSDYTLVYGPSPRVGSGQSFPPSYTVENHAHDRDQVLYSGSGMMTVSTDRGAWLLPPERALWIPAGTVHSVKMIGPVLARSLFIETSLQVRSSQKCEVIIVSQLLNALLMSAYEHKDVAPDLHKALLMSMLLMEVRRASVEPLSLAMPTTKALATKCRAYLEEPTPHETIDNWCDELGMSRRSFTRLFRRETGESFASWRQKVCLFSALPALAAGETVTHVAFRLGYSSAAAFTTMFRRTLGATPREYLNTERNVA